MKSKYDELNSEDWVKAKYEATGSMNAIADELECNVKTVRRAMDRHGIERKPRSRYKELNSKRWIEEAYDRLGSVRAIAKEIGCSEKAIWRAVNRHNIQTRANRESRWEELNDPKWLYNKYWEEGLSKKEIGNLLGCTFRAVERAMDRFDIKTRTREQLGMARINETGNAYGKLIVIHQTLNSPVGRTRWVCICKCGQITIVGGKRLRNGKTTSCGCARSMPMEKNPAWNGGTSFEPYSPSFNESLKEQIRERDNHECQLCHKKEAELNRALTIHHIDYDKQNSAPSNLVALCNDCHLQTNTHTELFGDASL